MLNPFTTRLGKVVFLLCVAALLTISSALSYQLVAKRLNTRPLANPNAGVNTGIAYPSSANICTDGCKAHQNWIEFYLPADSFLEDSLRLKTSVFLGQILTVGISATPCQQQAKVGYTCLDMDLSHHLLSMLTGLDLTPLTQLRDTNNWWLEYTPKQ